jgi:hypothetical protein
MGTPQLITSGLKSTTKHYIKIHLMILRKDFTATT